MFGRVDGARGVADQLMPMVAQTDGTITRLRPSDAEDSIDRLVVFFARYAPGLCPILEAQPMHKLHRYFEITKELVLAEKGKKVEDPTEPGDYGGPED